MPHLDLPEFAGNIALALALGVVIGLERQWRQHPAGLRTTALVAIGAALFVSLSRLIPGDSSPTRIAAYVVSGIGFLGGGVIIKEGANVRGVTTAATLWCSAAVGTLAGLGFGLQAAVGTGVVLLVVMGLRPVSKGLDLLRIRSEGVPGEYRLRVACGAKDDGEVREALAQQVTARPGLAVTSLTVKKKKGHKRVVIVADLRAEPANDAAVQGLVTHLLGKRGVTAANWEKIAPVVE